MVSRGGFLTFPAGPGKPSTAAGCPVEPGQAEAERAGFASRLAAAGMFAARAALWAMLAAIAVKAASADIIWDEAWTYLTYGRTPGGFLILDIANDHPLNSLLIWVFTRVFGDAVFAIRLPNIIAGGLYLLTCAQLLTHVRHKAAVFAICVLNPYLLDYFALARGYGLAVSLVQIGLVTHAFSARPRPGLLLGLVLLASLSIFSTAILLYSLILGLSLHGGEWARSEQGRGLLIAAGVLGVLPLLGLAWVSRDGVPIYGSNAGLFDAIGRGIARMYVGEAWTTIFAVAAGAAVLALIFWRRRQLDQRARLLLLASATSLWALWAAAAVTGKPLPTGRVLLPFLPLWTLTVIALLESEPAGATPSRPEAAPVRKSAPLAGGLALCAGLAVLYVGRLDFERYLDWPLDYRLQSRLVQALAQGGCLPHAVWGRYGHVYYLDRWFPPDRRPPDTRCP